MTPTKSHPTIAGPVEVVFAAMFGKQQQDAHMNDYRFIKFHYGSVERWQSYKAYVRGLE